MILPFKVNVLRGHGNGMFVSSVYAIDPNTSKMLVYDDLSYLDINEDSRFEGNGWFEWIDPHEYFEYEGRYKAELYEENNKEWNALCDKAEEMIEDINVNEIADHLNEETLFNWCGAWREEAKSRLEAIREYGNR